MERRRQERVQAGGKRKTRYEGSMDCSESAAMPDIKEQSSSCRPKQAKCTPAKDSMLDGTAQDCVQNMMDLEQNHSGRQRSAPLGPKAPLCVGGRGGESRDVHPIF